MAVILEPFGTRYQELDTCLNDYREWYINNQERVTTLTQCVGFLRLAIDGRLYILHLLRNEIVALRNTHTDSSQLDEALDLFTHWYAQHAETITDVMPLLGFLKEATDNSLHLLHLMRDELRTAQSYKARESMLYLPTGLR